MSNSALSSSQKLQQVRVSKKDSGKITEKPKKRKFTAQQKQDILKQIERCKANGQSVGELLRKEGLYSSQVSQWKGQLKDGIDSLSSKKRGRKPSSAAAYKAELQKLERKVAKLERKLYTAEGLIEIQKKVSQMFAVSMEEMPEEY